MKVIERRYDFIKMEVKERVVEIPDTPPDTPFMSLVLKRAAKVKK